MSAEQVTTINVVIFYVFLGFLVIGTLRTILRALAYRRENFPLPVLLKRDLVSRTGLTLPFVLILFARATGNGVVWGTQIWYPLLTGIPAIVSVVVYAYYELFVIDRLGPEDRLARLERKIDENTRVSTDAFHEANTVNLKIETTNKNIEKALAQAADREMRLEQDRDEAKDERRQWQVDETARRSQIHVDDTENRREADREVGRAQVRVQTEDAADIAENRREADREVGRAQVRAQTEAENEDPAHMSMRESVDETRREVGDLHRDKFPEEQGGPGST